MAKIAVIAKLQVQRGRGADVVAAFDAVRDVVDAEQGTELFLAHRDESEPDIVWVYELYSDSEAFEHHVNGGGLPSVKHLLAGTPEIHRLPVAAGKEP